MAEIGSVKHAYNSAVTTIVDRQNGEQLVAAGPSQSDVVVQGIKAMITSGQLGAGSRLPVEKDLAVVLGVSRGSLREGVRALCIMGVLETRQGDGTYVTALDAGLLLAPMGFMIDLQTVEHRKDLHAVRRLLESEAAAGAALHITVEQLEQATAVLGAMRPLVLAEAVTDHESIMAADVAFHHIIANASLNGALAALIDALADSTLLARRSIGEHHGEQVRRAYDEHLAILHAVRNHEPDRARLLMSHHLLVVEDLVEESDPTDDQ
jgi:GntR family transcriptional regulator, transcriptional repressor for pyruvate dehydrogenase complex